LTLSLSLVHSPELVADERRVTADVSTKVDVYSFGILLWEIWVRKKPYYDLKAVNCYHFMNLIVGGKRPTIETAHKVPPRLEALITRCWSHKPTSRPTFDEIVLEISDARWLDMAEGVAEGVAEGGGRLAEQKDEPEEKQQQQRVGQGPAEAAEAGKENTDSVVVVTRSSPTSSSTAAVGDDEAINTTTDTASRAVSDATSGEGGVETLAAEEEVGRGVVSANGGEPEHEVANQAAPAPAALAAAATAAGGGGAAAV
jgi:hypothetical protein